MTRNPYLPPATRLQMEPTSSGSIPIAISAIAGILSWLAYWYVVRLTNVLIWIPLIEAGRWDARYTTLELAGTAVLVYAVFGAALAVLKASNPWAIWCAFVLGIIACIFFRSSFRTGGFELAVGVLGRSAFLGAVASSGATLVFLSWRRSRRSHTPRKSTRET